MGSDVKMGCSFYDSQGYAQFLNTKDCKTVCQMYLLVVGQVLWIASIPSI